MMGERSDLPLPLASYRLHVVLVGIQHPGNLGAVCRSLLNHGFDSLRLVNPQCHPDDLEARNRAKHAGRLLDSCKLFYNFEEAISDCSLVVGTSGKREIGDKTQKRHFMYPWEFTERISKIDQDVALVFGEEGKGWTYAKYLLEFERGNGYSSELYQQLQQIKAKSQIEDASGSKLSEDPSFMESVAKLEVQINAMEATELRILGSLSAGQNVGPESSLLKTRGTEIGQAITELAVELVGYYGIPFHNPGPEIGINEPAIGSRFANTAAPRYFNYRKASIYAGSNEIQRNIMAKLVLGL